MKKLLFFNTFLLTFLFIFQGCVNKQNNTNNEDSEMMMVGKTVVPRDIVMGESKKGTISVDTKNSKIEWIGKKPTGTHDGTVNVSKGFIELNKKGEITNGEFVLDMNSISCSDLQGKKKESLDSHLKDADFFNTEEYPTSTFKINEVSSDTIYGTLTIKGIAQKIKFPFKEMVYTNKDTTTLEYRSEIIIDRTLFDIKYSSKTFFPDIGDRFIYDDFTIILNPLVFK